jgi:hypothetical protein
MPSYMGRGNEDLGWRVPMLFAAIGVVTLIVYAVWPDFSATCPTKEKGDTALCAREWLGVASGYFATAAAAVTIYFLNRQNSHLKNQTDFLIGNSDPTFDVVEHQIDSAEAVVRLVNWNRRGLLLEGIEVDGVTDGIVNGWEVKIDGRQKSPIGPFSLQFQPPYSIPGWEDRQSAPHNAKVKLYLHTVLVDKAGNPRSFPGWPENTKITAVVMMLGERHQTKRFSGYLKEAK